MPHELFRTSDLALTAYLMVKGYAIKGIECDGNGKGTFLIEDKPQRQGHMLEFFNHQALIEPLVYLDQIKSLKAMLRQ